MKQFFIFFLLMIFLSPVFANSIPAKRFDPSLEIYESLFNRIESTDTNTLIDNMITGRRRIAAFNLQALGQIYEDYPVQQSNLLFKKSIRFEAKSIEDAIGAYDKWNIILQSLSPDENSTAQIQRAESNLELSRDLLTYVLTGERSKFLKETQEDEFQRLIKRFENGKKKSNYKNIYWVNSSKKSIVQNMKDDLNAFPFLSYNKDRKFVLNKVMTHLKKIKETKFDFNYLEDTQDKKGLHEFRRELRWFSFQAQNLNGTLQISIPKENEVENCPSEPLKALLQKKELIHSPYTKLPKSPFADEDICPISRCLYYSVSKTINDIGLIKDKVELLNFTMNLHNKTPNAESQLAQVILNDFTQSKTLDYLIQEINLCLD